MYIAKKVNAVEQPKINEIIIFFIWLLDLVIGVSHQLEMNPENYTDFYKFFQKNILEWVSAFLYATTPHWKSHWGWVIGWVFEISWKWQQNIIHLYNRYLHPAMRFLHMELGYFWFNWWKFLLMFPNYVSELLMILAHLWISMR